MPSDSAVSVLPTTKKSKKKSLSSSSHSSSSSYSSSATPSDPARVIPSTLPDSFRPHFDIISELEENRERYIGEEQVSIYNVPLFILSNLNRVRTSAEEELGSKPGLSSTINCCLSYGIKVIQSNHDSKELFELRRQLESARTQSSYLYGEIERVFTIFDLSVPDYAMSGTKKRQGLRLTEGLRDAVAGLSDQLGVSFSVLTTMGVILALAHQSPVLEDHREMMWKISEGFLFKLKARKAMLEVLLAMLRGER